MSVKAVFCDVDGTLLNSNHRILDSTMDAIRQLSAAGIRFVIVTARGPLGIYPIFKRYNFVSPMVCYSGALILDEEGNVLQSNTLLNETAQAVISYIEEKQMDCSWNIYSMNSWIVKNENDERVKREECIVEAKAKCGSVDDVPKGAGVSKILCMCNPLKTVEIEEALKAKFPCLSIMKSSDILIEVMNKGITKKGAVSFLCDRWEIPLNETVAFGDNFNDYDMLKNVGTAFLMGNAPEELKQQFKHITLGNDEGGIYQGLRALNIVK